MNGLNLIEIVKAYPDEAGEDGTIYVCGEYRVVTRHKQKVTHLFMGSYTQCLTYVGALAMGKSPKTAMYYARGAYR